MPLGSALGLRDDGAAADVVPGAQDATWMLLALVVAHHQQRLARLDHEEGVAQVAWPSTF